MVETSFTERIEALFETPADLCGWLRDGDVQLAADSVAVSETCVVARFVADAVGEGVCVTLHSLYPVTDPAQICELPRWVEHFIRFIDGLRESKAEYITARTLSVLADECYARWGSYSGGAE